MKIYLTLYFIKYITMDTNKENIKIIYITREHDKICILENIINCVSNIIFISIKDFETIVSNLIDSFILEQDDNIEFYLNILKQHISEQELLNLIVDISFAIAKQKPYLLTIKNNDKTNKYIKYINNNYILPLF